MTILMAAGIQDPSAAVRGHQTRRGGMSCPTERHPPRLRISRQDTAKAGHIRKFGKNHQKIWRIGLFVPYFAVRKRIMRI